jgi:hypothetical protein
MIHFKRYVQDGKVFHQVLVDGRVIGSVRQHGRWWCVCRWQGWGMGSGTKREAVEKLLETRCPELKFSVCERGTQKIGKK